jgi:hypothetical protein
MGERNLGELSVFVVAFLVFVVLVTTALPVAATQYMGTVPSADGDVPGAYVRYAELDKGENVAWSWKSTGELDFEISLPSSNETLRREKDASSLGGHLAAERSGVYRFAWYNDDPGDTVDIDYTVHEVQSGAWVLGLAVIGIIAVAVIVYVLRYHRRRTDSLGEALEDMMEESAQTPRGGNRFTNRAILVGFVAGLVAISVISGLYVQREDLEATRGSELEVTVENAANVSRSVSVSVTGPGGEVLQEASLELATGQTGQVLILASPEWDDVVLNVQVNDGTGGPTTDKAWTPTQGQKDRVDFVLE